MGSKDADLKETKTPIEALCEGGSCPIEGLSARSHMAKQNGVCRRSLLCDSRKTCKGPMVQSKVVCRRLFALESKEATRSSLPCVYWPGGRLLQAIKKLWLNRRLVCNQPLLCGLKHALRDQMFKRKKACKKPLHNEPCEAKGVI